MTPEKAGSEKGRATLSSQAQGPDSVEREASIDERLVRATSTSGTIALLADSHVGGPGGESGPLVRQLLELPDLGCRHLVLLGDLFQVWVADTRYENDEVREVLGALRSLRRAGVRLDYVEGNRDFFVAAGPYAEIFNSVGTECSFEHEGLRYLVVHGDGLNDQDRQYLAWRWLSKSALVRWAMFHLPRALAKRLVHSTEARLSETNFKHKAQVPEVAIRDYAERRLAEGYDRLLLGHFHEPHVWEVAGGEVHLLDAWFRSRELEWL